MITNTEVGLITNTEVGSTRTRLKTEWDMQMTFEFKLTTFAPFDLRRIVPALPESIPIFEDIHHSCRGLIRPVEKMWKNHVN